jgi:N-acetylglucosamine-6-sulfatase
LPAADLATHGRRRALVALALAAALAAVLAGALGCGSGGGPATTATAKPIPVDQSLAKRTKGGPNFLVVLMDDQAENSFKARYMPQTFRWIVGPGTLFRNGLAAPPLCCPDRAGFLTGGYPHNSGVFSNHPGYSTLKGKGNTLPVWLTRAGYRTALIGKYLNHYYGQEGLTPAPGWGQWFAQTNREQYYDYPVSDNGAVRHYGSSLADYSSNVFSHQAADFVKGQAGAGHPFFLWLTYNAPHGVKDPGPACGNHNPEPPKPSDARRLKGTPLPRPPSFNERDVSDKPTAIAKLPRLGRHDVSRIQRGWRCTLATMSAADNGVGRVMRALKRSGQLHNTIVFYMSDNGFYFGEHRIFSGKQYPYEPGLRVPYAVRVPARYRSRQQSPTSTQVVSEQDATATILDYAGVPSCAAAGKCRRVDGRTMTPLLGSRGAWPAGRGVLAEIKADQGQYSAIRTQRWIYIRYDDGESELYDLRSDPYQLRNLAGRRASAPVERRLAARLDRLRRCSGARGVVKPAPGKPLCE